MSQPPTADRIRDFLQGDAFAVVGASTDREKYGNKVLRCYLQHALDAHPINPKAPHVEGRKAFPDLASLTSALGRPIHGVSIITPPPVTLKVLEDAAGAGVSRVWLQPGAESPEAIRRAEELGLKPIAGGPCLLVVLGYDDRWAPASA
jgi:predicted CoA-binding protein